MCPVTPGVIDITPRGVGKWSALLELCRMEGIPPENVAAAGNYLNDRDMIEHAGIGIAVGNAVRRSRRWRTSCSNTTASTTP